MSDDLMQAIRVAWQKIEPVLARDPDELAARRSRRRQAMLLRPPRAWCLAVRACDTRLTPAHFVMTPEYPSWWDAEHHRQRHVEHEVTLEARALRWLCRPVSIPRPGVDWRDAAEMLGVHPCAIYAATRRGVFSVRRIAGLSGKHGAPIPIVYTPSLIDPASLPLGNMPGIEWGTHWRYLSDHIPDDLCQTLVRRPTYRPFRGDLKFRGWRWICPGCQRETLRVFYPMPALLRADFVKKAGDDPDDVAPPLPCFACGPCHQINDEGRLRSQGWDTLIAHITGGLLYGREVKKPSWYTAAGKKRFVPRPACQTSKLQAAILPLLLDTTLTPAQISKTLRLRLSSVHTSIRRLLKHHNATNRAHLRELLKPPAEEARRAG